MVDNNYLLTCDQHQVNSALTLRNIWEEEEFLDVTLACDDGQIAAHKVIISAASPFFRNILNRNPHSHPLLYIKEANKKNMQVLLNFIYTGEAKVDQDDLTEFLALANSLEVKGLVSDDMDLQHENKKKRKKRKEKNEDIGETTGLKKISFSKNKSKSEDFSKKEDDDDIRFEWQDEVQNDDSDSLVENEEMGSFLIQDSSDTSMSEYESKVSELMPKNGSNCIKCEHTAKTRGHLKEHVQKHIEGYTFNCETCNRTFSSKNQLRHHARRCKSSSSNALILSNLESTDSDGITLD